ncbi:MAG: branched-chain amino acid ABC transporter substrate-binding protein [Thermoleophilaceae bacterium]|nr:branched-chain amino acid ABC transporter substrate-binding protein [Thermoleophilaceae bacterium]
MRTALRVFGSCCLAALCLLFVAGCGGSSESGSTVGKVPANSVRIGLEGPLTGSQKSVGIGMLNGARLAADELNAAGGIGGKKVSIVAIDDAADPPTGVAAAKAAIAGGLSGVVGPYNSGVGAETLPLYIDAGLVPVRLTSADETEGLGYTLQPMTSQIAPVATKAITSWLKAKTVAIVFDDSQTYTKSANDAMKSKLEQAGVKIVADQAIKPGKKSYESAVTKLDKLKPDLIYAITYYPEGGLIAKAMFEAKSPATCLADFGAYDNGFIKAAGTKAAQDCSVVGVPAPDDFPNSAKPLAAFKKSFNAAPDIWTPYVYDSVNILADAAAKAGGFDSTKLKSALDAEAKWQGWTGEVTFDPTTGNRLPAPVAVVTANSSGVFHVDKSWAKASGFSH